ncbi:MAG: phosphate ABC transporter substrate-binding protein [Verrucomicrobiota bacterium]|nr:phosphate ABC transporter substrate-binding protein [Verrucomicrobiota bacterium]
MKRLSLVSALLVLAHAATAGVLRINGSTTVNLPVAEAAEILRAEKRMQIQVDTQGGSSGGISMLAEGLVQIGMSSKPLSAEDRAKYPRVRFKETRIGEDAVALVVSRDVWEGGVRALSKQQARDIYEGHITDWKALGGKSQRVVFFNKEPGRGTWEVFAHWLYGAAQNAPPVSLPEVGGNEETRSKVGSTRGAISQLSSAWADGKKVFALDINDGKGQAIAATAANIASGKYPMSRPLFVLTNGEPAAEAKVLIDYLLSEPGQALVRKHGYLALQDLGQ